MPHGCSILAATICPDWLHMLMGLHPVDGMAWNVLLLLLGMLLIAKGGDLFTDSAINIARATRIPPAIIGATIVSMATTFPELMVSMTGVLRGSASLGVGNALGSCCCNIGLIVGSCAVLQAIVSYRRGKLSPIIAQRRMLVGPGLFMLTGGVALWAFGAISGTASVGSNMLATWHGIALGLVLLCYLGYASLVAIRSRHRHVPIGEEDAKRKLQGFMGKEVVLFTLGATLVFVGSRQLVGSATQIAYALNVSELVIGLTIVAIGTSLPEFTISIMAVLKGHGDLGIGNIIGANVLNICGVLGACAVISPLPLEARTMAVHLPMMLLLMMLLPLLAWRRESISARAGALLLCVYGGYMLLI